MTVKAIVLAAGYGTRLYPLTKNTPKPLLLITRKPMIEHILYKIEELEDINEIIIITNNKFFNNFYKWSKKYKSSKQIKILNDNTNLNEERLGAIGDINFAIQSENINDNALVIGGDNLFEFSLIDFYNFFKEKKTSVIALYDLKDKNKIAKKYGVANINKNNKIIDFEEKPENPKSTLASTACYFFTKEDLEELKKYIENHKSDNLGDFIKWLSGKKNVYGFVFSEKWFDIGSYDQLREADKIWSKK